MPRTLCRCLTLWPPGVRLVGLFTRFCCTSIIKVAPSWRLSMSYKQRLTDIDRGSPESVTSQIVGAFSDAIESGELAAGEKLPPTRELAELAGVNHLTAARAYRRLAELGLVTGRVGSGTFVRAAAPVAGEPTRPGESNESAWQHYVLPEARETYGDRILVDMFSH